MGAVTDAVRTNKSRNPMHEMLYFQAGIESAGQMGPIVGNPHLNWPLGTEPWSHPQAGFLILSLAFILIKLLAITSFGAFQLIFLLSGVLAALGIMYLLRSLTRNFAAISIVMSLVIGVGPFTLLKAEHLNVASFYILPVALAVVLRMYELTGRRRKIIALLILGVCAAVSPIWWTSVVVMILVALLPAGIAIGPKRNWGRYGAPLISTLVGLSVPVTLALLQAIPGSVATRGAWDSNVYGGHFVDFFAASPFLNAHIQRLQSVLPGSSVEMSRVGLVGAMFVIVAIFSLLMGPRLAIVAPKLRILFVATLVAFLLFVLGGFGNLQAGLAVLLDTTSPARVWARLSILLAILGAAWFLVFLLWAKGRGQTRSRVIFRAFYGIVCILLTASWALDFSTITENATRAVLRGDAPQKFSEYGAIEFLKRSLTPCAVAQLPADSTPIPLMTGPWTAENMSDYYYRGYVPYLMAPDFSWSFGDTSPDSFRGPTATLPTTVGDAQLATLRENGYCAVLYDKSFSKLSTENMANIPGQSLEVSRPADFGSARYDVYLLP